MNKQSLIPFALRVSDQQFVDVSEVKRGKQCGCICPSCKTALIARQGEVNGWCFAHVAQGGANTVKNKCTFSFWVSVLAMAKQILSNGGLIKLPGLTLYNEQCGEVPITAKHTLSFDSVQIEQRINSIRFDALLTFEHYAIAVVFSTPSHQPCLNELTRFTSERIGVLEISLVKAHEWSVESEQHGKYAQILRENILEKESNKRWLYHPRQSTLEKKLHSPLTIEPPATGETSTTSPRNAKTARNKKIGVPIHRRGRTIYKNIYLTDDITRYKPREGIPKEHYRCVKCQSEWYGTHHCNVCATHLYSVINKAAQAQ